MPERTEADRKGGHLARRRDGGLVLRETAQTPEEDLDAFQDASRHRWFHANNLWVDLEALRRVLDARDGVLGLPMIVNRKTVDPADKGSTPVIQLESAMGAAIAVFDGARPLRVPRTRFLPVKTTSDLLVLRSDAYELRDGAPRGAGGRPHDGAPGRARRRPLQAHRRLRGPPAGGAALARGLRPAHGARATSSSARAWCAAGR